jgi:hypothetical protein
MSPASLEKVLDFNACRILVQCNDFGASLIVLTPGKTPVPASPS